MEDEIKVTLDGEDEAHEPVSAEPVVEEAPSSELEPVSAEPERVVDRSTDPSLYVNGVRVKK